MPMPITRQKDFFQLTQYAAPCMHCLLATPKRTQPAFTVLAASNRYTASYLFDPRDMNHPVQISALFEGKLPRQSRRLCYAFVSP